LPGKSHPEAMKMSCRQGDFHTGHRFGQSEGCQDARRNSATLLERVLQTVNRGPMPSLTEYSTSPVI
jgi:hypothetical protein